MAKKDILHPYRELDILYYYNKVAPALKNFLKGKEIATRTFIPKANIKYFIRRGSEDGNLYINDIKIDHRLLKLRAKGRLHDYEKILTKKEKLLWHYFVPRKFVEMHYSVNNEKPDLNLERIYFDIDRKNNTSEDARIIALALVNELKDNKNKNFKKLIKKIVVLWTGKSFHIILLLRKKQSHKFYEKFISGESEESYTNKFVDNINEKINKKIKIRVSSAHERKSNIINIDSSQSPSGKLGRAPFSLHVKDATNYDGICVPLSINELKNKNLISKLEKLTPEKVIKNLNKYKRLL